MNLRNNANSGPSIGFRDIRPAHVVDDDGRRQRGEEVPEFRQIDRLEVDHDMPAEPADARGDLHQFVLRREVDEALDEIEAHAADARAVEPLQFVVAHVAPDRRDAARLAAARQAGVDHRAIVGAMAGRLHDDVTREARDGRATRRVRPCSRRRAYICAQARNGNAAPGPKTWQCASTLPAGGRKARLARLVEPVEPALGLLERPADGLGRSRS